MLMVSGLYGLSAICALSGVVWLFTVPPISSIAGCLSLASAAALGLLFLYGVNKERVG